MTWRLLREPLGLLGPWPHVAACLRGDVRPFALVGRWAGRGAILAAEPLALLRGAAALEALREPAGDDGAEDAVAGAVGGGWFGWIAYEDGRRFEPTIPPGPPGGISAPTELAFYDHVLRCDPHGQWFFEALVTPARGAALRERLAELRRRLAQPTSQPKRAALSALRWRAPGPAGHRDAVGACVERIAAGELSQANLAITIDGQADGHAFDLLARGAAALAPDYGAAFASGERAVVSFSPELYLRRRGDAVASEPIKGTALPGAAAREALLSSAKDAAEHVMIVDLVRNDLGRVCTTGSVEVTALHEPREQVGVQHLVSRIEGRLREGVSDADLIAASFPPGSVTGAPKVRAQRVIGELEAVGRGVFCGAIGYRSPVAGLELSVAIRTLEGRGDDIRLQVGGGIVSDSDPDAELAECERKARPLLRALGAELPPRATRSRQPAAGRALAHGHRPDPAGGLTETLRTEHGAAPRAAEHARRLAGSAAALYGLALDTRSLAGTAERAAVGTAGIGRLRLELDPTGTLRTSWSPATVAPLAAPLVPYVLPGGLGAHKWRDRELLQTLAGKGGTPLLLDTDGEVLEASWAAVVLVEGDRLVLAPEDERRLPSATARRLAAIAADAIREPFDLPRLQAADGVLLSAAVSLLVAVRGDLDLETLRARLAEPPDLAR